MEIKKLITEKQNEILVEQVTKEDVVIVIKEGKIVGTIVHDGYKYWRALHKEHGDAVFSNFSDVIKNVYLNCEFRVIRI